MTEQDDRQDAVASRQNIKQIELLTEAIASLAYCLSRGPCWGVKGEVRDSLNKAWDIVEKLRKKK